MKITWCLIFVIIDIIVLLGMVALNRKPHQQHQWFFVNMCTKNRKDKTSEKAKLLSLLLLCIQFCLMHISYSCNKMITTTVVSIIFSICILFCPNCFFCWLLILKFVMKNVMHVSIITRIRCNFVMTSMFSRNACAI